MGDLTQTRKFSGSVRADSVLGSTRPVPFSLSVCDLRHSLCFSPLSPSPLSTYRRPPLSSAPATETSAALCSLLLLRTLAMIRSLHKPRLLLPSSNARFFSTEPGSKLGFGLGFQPSPSKDADAISHLLIAHHNPYHPIESSLQLAGTLTLTPSLTLQTLIRLKNHSKIAFSFFLFARDHAHAALDAETYDLMVDILGKVHQFDVVWQLIVEMDQRGVSPTPRTFGILMRRYIAAGFTRSAIRAFDDIEGFIGREANGEEFKMLLDTLCKYGYPKVVH